MPSNEPTYLNRLAKRVRARVDLVVVAPVTNEAEVSQECRQRYIRSYPEAPENVDSEKFLYTSEVGRASQYKSAEKTVDTGKLTCTTDCDGRN